MCSWRNPVLHDARFGGMLARNCGPQVDLRDLWFQKNGVAKYTDGRDKGKGWIRKD
jgi:hypothetical protein